MKVALVNKYWFLKGGTERVLFLTKELLESAGHEVVCFGMDHPSNVVTLSHAVPFIETETPSAKDAFRVIYNRRAKQLFLDFLRTEKPDIIHFHNIYHQLSFSLLDAAKLCGIPTVLTLHDYQLFSPNYMLYHDGAPYMRTLGGSFYRCVGDRCLGSLGKSLVGTAEAYMRVWSGSRFRPDHLIAPSMYMKQVAVQCGYTDGDISHVPNPVPPLEIQSSKKHTQQVQRYMVFVGRFVEEKGIKVLLQTWREMVDIPLVLVGDGPCMPWVKEYIRAHSLEERVEVKGWCDAKTTQTLLAGAVCSVFPSQWPENCPMAVLSSLQVGTLPVGSTMGGMKEMLDADFSFAYDSRADMVQVLYRVWNLTEKERVRVCTQLQEYVLPKHGSIVYVQTLIRVYSDLCSKK